MTEEKRPVLRIEHEIKTVNGHKGYYTFDGHTVTVRYRGVTKSTWATQRTDVESLARLMLAELSRRQ